MTFHSDAENHKREVARFEAWMDATRIWWRDWKRTDPVACSQLDVADMMQEAFQAGFETGFSTGASPRPEGNAPLLLKEIREYLSVVGDELRPGAKRLLERSAEALVSPQKTT